MCNLWQRPWQRHAYNSLARHIACHRAGITDLGAVAKLEGVGQSSLIITPIWLLWQVSFSVIGGERGSQIDRVR